MELVNVDKLKRKIRSNVEIDPVTGCWVWQRSFRPAGYGVTWIPEQKRTIDAHRLAYMLWIGEPRTGLVLDHEVCDNKECCNPWHLVPKTNWENVRRSTSYFAERFKADSCVNGHEFTEENVYIHPQRGTRNCRECKRDRDRRYKAEKKLLRLVA